MASSSKLLRVHVGGVADSWLEAAEEDDDDVDADAASAVESLGCCEDGLEVSEDAEAFGKDDKLAEAVDNVGSVSAVLVKVTALHVTSDDDEDDADNEDDDEVVRDEESVVW